MAQVPTDIGGQLTAKVGNVPALASAGTRNGAAIDRQSFHSGLLVAKSGAIAGAPTAQTLDAKIQDSDDGSTNWNDYKPDGTNVAAITQITAANTIARKAFNLMRAKRFIRVVEIVAFTGGTTPTIGAEETVVLGGAHEQPPA